MQGGESGAKFWARAADETELFIVGYVWCRNIFVWKLLPTVTLCGIG